MTLAACAVAGSAAQDTAGAPVEIVDLASPAAVPAATWDRLAAGRPPFARRAWLAAAPPPGALHLLAACRGGDIVGLLPVYLLTAPPAHSFHAPREVLCGSAVRQLLGACDLALAERAAAAPWLPAAFGASPYGYRGGVIAPREAPGEATVTGALLDAADALCRDQGVRVALHYGLTARDDAPLLAALAARGATLLAVGAHCDLALDQPDLDGYFGSLGARGRKLRAEHRKAAQRGGTVLWAAPGEAFDPGSARAAAGLFADAARRRADGPPPAELYRALLGAWPERRALLLGAGPSNRPRSALLVLVEGEVLYPKLFGSRERDDYYHLTYCRLPALAWTQGFRRIAYGGGSHAAKLLRGAHLLWLLGAVTVYDRQLTVDLAPLLPRVHAARVAHFRQLAARFRPDHEAPPPPSTQPPERPRGTTEKGARP